MRSSPPLALLLAGVLSAAGSVVSLPAAADANLVISSTELQVRLAPTFPSVIDYTDRASGSVLTGTSETLDTVALNGTPYKTEVSGVVDGSTARYTLAFPDLDGVRLEATLSVQDRVVTFRIEKVTDTESFRVGTIDIPGHDLVSVRSDQQGAQVSAGRVTSAAAPDADTLLPVTTSTPADAKPVGSAYAIVNTSSLAAAIETNSIAETATSENTRIMRQATKVGEATEVGLWSGQWTYRAKGAPFTEELPWAKVVVTGDRNGDAKVDWQDGAVAFHQIGITAPGAEDVSERVVTHIPFNFASQANNPFLKTLDNVKRISLATDGLEQLAILKGYAQEGHDSAHPDYGGNYNVRAGGLADLNTLASKGKDWNASFGVHVNTTEAYAEAKAFSDTLVDPKAKGWDWLGQSFYIDQARDLTSGDVAKRFKQLREETDPNLKFLYMDVYYSHGWKADRLQKELRDQGWLLGTEWSDKLERNSTWSHWSSEPTYGGAHGIASKVIRFIRNGEKDVWIDNNPLLGMASIVEWEGWANKSDWNAFYANIWNRNLPAKFLQKQDITSWTDHEIKLTGHVRVTDASGKREIFVGADRVLADKSYLLPWAGKAYHWNPVGGQSTWPVPKQWVKEATLQYFKLTDRGREKVGEVPVVDGQVTLTAEQGVAYVLDNREAKRKSPEYGEGGHLTDPGFNAANLDAWTVNGTASVEHNARGQYEAVVPAGEATMLSAPISGLKQGSRYAVSAWVEVQPGRSRTVTLKAGGAANHVERSTAKDGVAQDEKYGTYFQRVTTRFTASGETDTLTLDVAGGDAVVKVDDLRVVETTKSDKDGTVAFWDFEDNEQGWGPFVLTDPGLIRTVRAQKHAPYTQAGWNGNLVDQALNGDWSLKSHEEGELLVYRTTPQTVRFEPGHRYKVSFAFENSFAGHYAFVTGYDRPQPVETARLPFAQQRTPGEFAHAFVAGDCGDSWVGIRKVGSAVDQADFVMDDFTVVDLGPSQEAAACATLAVNAKPQLVPGSANKVDVAFTNHEKVAATEVTTAFTAPQGWTAKPESSAMIASVAPGATGKAVWLVTPPAGLPAGGSHELAATATYTAGAKKPSVAASTRVGTVPAGYIPQSQMKVAGVSSEESEGEDTRAVKALDGDPSTWWGTNWSGDSPNYPHFIALDLGGAYNVKELRYLPRQNHVNDRIKDYEVYVSADGVTWGSLVAKGTWPNSTAEQVVALNGVSAKFVKLVGLSSINGNPWAGAAELNVVAAN